MSFTDKRFRLKASSLGVETLGDIKRAVWIPADAIVLVLSGPLSNESKLLDVLWNDRTLAMFIDDLKNRGDEIGEAGA